MFLSAAGAVADGFGELFAGITLGQDDGARKVDPGKVATPELAEVIVADAPAPRSLLIRCVHAIDGCTGPEGLEGDIPTIGGWVMLGMIVEEGLHPGRACNCVNMFLLAHTLQAHTVSLVLVWLELTGPEARSWRHA